MVTAVRAVVRATVGGERARAAGEEGKATVGGERARAAGEEGVKEVVATVTAAAATAAAAVKVEVKEAATRR